MHGCMGEWMDICICVCLYVCMMYILMYIWICIYACLYDSTCTYVHRIGKVKLCIIVCEVKVSAS